MDDIMNFPFGMIRMRKRGNHQTTAKAALTAFSDIENVSAREYVASLAILEESSTKSTLITNYMRKGLHLYRNVIKEKQTMQLLDQFASEDAAVLLFCKFRNATTYRELRSAFEEVSSNSKKEAFRHNHSETERKGETSNVNPISQMKILDHFERVIARILNEMNSAAEMQQEAENEEQYSQRMDVFDFVKRSIEIAQTFYRSTDSIKRLFDHVVQVQNTVNAIQYIDEAPESTS